MGKLSDKEQEDLLRKAGIGGSSIKIPSLAEIESFGDKTSIRKMVGDIAAYRRMLKENITFIDPKLSAMVPFTRENLYLLCATSGTGKSTTAANISYPLWKQQKKILIITNEESQADVIFRIACLHLGLSFNDYKKNRMPTANVKQIVGLFEEIAKFVKVLDVSFNDGITSVSEGIKGILEQVKDSDYSCVLIDYWQNIKRTLNGDTSHYNILDDLRIYLGQFIKSSNIPVVMFAQIYPAAGKRSTELEDRIKMGKTIYETATVVIEIVTDFNTYSSKFIVQKDRFGFQGKFLNCIFDNGRYKAVNDVEFKEYINTINVNNINGMVDMEEDDTYVNPEDKTDENV
jgi:archaellum biogenesis ATPase FlaH